VISLLGTFSISVDGETISGLPSGSQRLLVFLALHDHSVSRIAVAGVMWPEVTAQRAADSLRSSLARLDASTRAGITLIPAELGLGDEVTIDYIEARALAHRLLDSDTPIFDGDLASSAIAVLSRELLPDWTDEWILIESNDWRHLRASALEALALRLLRAGRIAEAAGAARAAIRVDPLRETPHASLIRIHLADGNQSDAIEAFESYRGLLRSALDIEPTTQLSDLVVTINGNEFAHR
jgi:DNA-binding SARP family transcriptional activator